VRNEEVIQIVKEERNILLTVTRRKDKWMGHIGKTEGRIEERGRRGRRHNHLLYDLKEKRGYCKLK
jgi:hypothetical protein